MAIFYFKGQCREIFLPVVVKRLHLGLIPKKIPIIVLKLLRYLYIRNIYFFNTPLPSQPSRDKISSPYTSGALSPGLRTQIVFRHQAESHEVSISCRLSAPPVDAFAPANRQRRQSRCKGVPTASVAGPMPLPPESGSPLPSSSTLQDTPSPALNASPPSKQTQKAARCRCEAELLRKTDQ